MNSAYASDLLLGKEGAAERYIDNVVEIGRVIRSHKEKSPVDNKSLASDN